MALISPLSSAVPSPPRVTQSADTVGSSLAKDRSKGADGFENAIGDALERLNDQHRYADQLARDAATGRLQNIEDYMIAATEAQLSTQLTVAFRNRAVEAFNEIMRMQV